MHITFSQIPPSKKNSKQIICRGNRPNLIPSKSYQSWHEEWMWKLKKYVPKNPIEKCEMICKFYFPDLKRRDMSNIFESIADILVDVGILRDDCWTVLSDTHNIAIGKDKENPRVEVYILNK